jgi:hypothetical protein
MISFCDQLTLPFSVGVRKEAQTLRIFPSFYPTKYSLSGKVVGTEASASGDFEPMP